MIYLNKVDISTHNKFSTKVLYLQKNRTIHFFHSRVFKIKCKTNAYIVLNFHVEFQYFS